MKRKTMLLAIAGVCALVLALPAQAAPGDPIVLGRSSLANAFPDPQSGQDDPAYNVYKAGYNLILEERWDEARKRLAEVAAKYPKSDYVDDASYWSAYALRHIDMVKARQAYEAFVEKYPKSSYYDDAVADLASIETERALATVYFPDSATRSLRTPRPPRAIIAPGITTGVWRRMGTEMRRMKWELRNQSRHMRSLGSYVGAVPHLFGESEKLDPKTRLKLEALAALGEGKEDTKSFEKLRSVALDRKQPMVLREQAITVLGDFRNHPVAPVFLDIAKNDTSEELQVVAVEYLRESAKNKEEALNMLAELYNTLPAKREEQRASILYEIADVGTDRAVDFLITVARTDDNYDLRSEAVYYLGSIGGEKARTALYDILEGQ